MKTDALRGIFENVIREQFPGVDIVSVGVKRELDADGDDVLNVTVIFRAESDLDATKVAGLVRHLRPRLREQGEDVFPIMSFVSEKEAQKAGLAAT